MRARGALRAIGARGRRVALLLIAGLLALPTAARSEQARIVLVSGDVVTGDVLERNADFVLLRHPVLGDLRIPIAQISPASTHPGLAGTSFLAGWDKEVGIGLTGSQGDTDEADLHLSLSLSTAGERRRWNIDARYEVGYSHSELDDHDAHVTALRDWLRPGSRWFLFAYGLYDYDHFEDWKHRLSIGGGPGYRLLPDGAFKLDARMGPFLGYEFGDQNSARPEAAGGLFANWTIRSAHTLTVSEVYYQTLDELEFRNVTRMEWKIRLTAVNHVSLKIGAANEYDSASRKSKDNLKYYGTVNFDF